MPNVRPDTTKNTVLSQGEQKRGFYGAPNKGYWCPLVSVDPKKANTVIEKIIMSYPLVLGNHRVFELEIYLRPTF